MKSTGEIPSRIGTGERGAFDEILVLQLRRAPWFLMSFAGHAVLVLLCILFSGKDERGADVRGEKTVGLIAEAESPVENVLDDPSIEPEDPVPVDEVAPDDETVESPDDHDESPTDSDRKETSGEGESAGRDFGGEAVGDAIGIGGGAGGGGPGGGGRFSRLRGKRKGRLPEDGAVGAGLDWLKAHQSPDGSWDCDNFMANGDPKKGALCDGRGEASYDVGVSGLALLAFLGAGHTYRDGPYRDCVRKGLKWLVAQQDAEGCFGPRSFHYTYNHAIAALAMAEAYGMTQSGIFRGPAQRGIDFVIAAQNPYKAWRYDVRPGDNDVSVTAWMAMALKSAQLAGLQVAAEPLKQAAAFIHEATDPETGRTGYVKKGERPVRPEGKESAFPAEETESLTAAGMLVRIFAGEDPAKSAMLKAGQELLLKRLPVWEASTGKIDHYYWYYGTLSMFQMGGAGWSEWNRKLQDAVIKTQRNDGNFKGSWDPLDAWGETGGRVYSTAVLTLCMEVYYRYDRVFGTR